MCDCLEQPTFGYTDYGLSRRHRLDWRHSEILVDWDVNSCDCKADKFPQFLL